MLICHAAQRIKKHLIEKAKIKASYAKLIARENQSQPSSAIGRLSSQQDESTNEQGDGAFSGDLHQPASNEPHPARQALIDAAPVSATKAHLSSDFNWGLNEEFNERVRQRPRSQKQVPFSREMKHAQQAKEEAVKRREDMAAALAQRERRRAERDRWRKAIEKSKGGGPHGQAKLGRQSEVLLEKVKRMVGEGKG